MPLEILSPKKFYLAKGVLERYLLLQDKKHVAKDTLYNIWIFGFLEKNISVTAHENWLQIELHSHDKGR